MSLKYRGVFGVCTCTAIGWLVGGPLGAVAGFSVGVLAAVAPEVIGGFLTLAVVATAALTTFEVGFEGGRPVSFVTSRPVALDMGRVSGIVLLCWMATQLIYRVARPTLRWSVTSVWISHRGVPTLCRRRQQHQPRDQRLNLGQPRLRTASGNRPRLLGPGR